MTTKTKKNKEQRTNNDKEEEKEEEDPLGAARPTNQVTWFALVRPASVCCPQDKSKTMRSTQCGCKRFCNLCCQRPKTTTMTTTPSPSTLVHVELETEVTSVTAIAPYLFNHRCCYGCDQQQETNAVCDLWFDLSATALRTETALQAATELPPLLRKRP